MAKDKSVAELNSQFLCENLNFAASEAYKRLRTNILFSFASEKSCRVIGVSSSAPSDGKSLTAINLSYSLAQLGKKTLVIDCDLRRPSLHAKLGLKQAPGLSNLLTEINSLGPVLQKYNPTDASKSFDILSAGDIPPNPSELLGSKRMASMIEKLSAVYNYIILDLPPVGAVADAQSITQLTDGIVLVIRENNCNSVILDDCLKQLQLAKANILGFVLNGSVQGASKSYSKYGKYGYGSSYGTYK